MRGTVLVEGAHLVVVAAGGQRRRRHHVGGADGHFVGDVAAGAGRGAGCFGSGNGHVLAGQDVLDALDGQRDLLLVAQTQDAKVFQILPRQLSDVFDGAVALASETGTVLGQSQQSQPLFQRILFTSNNITLLSSPLFNL